MRRGGALAGALSGAGTSTSFSAPHKSGLIPVARLESGSQRIRHRSQSQTGQWERPPQGFAHNILPAAGQEGPVSRATVDGSISMDRTGGPHWHSATRDSFTGGGTGSTPDEASSKPMQPGSWNQQQIESGWAAGPSSLARPRQRGPHRLKAMSTDGGLSQLQAQPSAPQWSPSVVYHEDSENDPDGWDEPPSPFRCNNQDHAKISARSYTEKWSGQHCTVNKLLATALVSFARQVSVHLKRIRPLLQYR